MQCDPISTSVALSDAGVQNRQNQIMQNWLRRKELVSPPYDKCGIFAKQDLEFHAWRSYRIGASLRMPQMRGVQIWERVTSKPGVTVATRPSRSKSLCKGQRVQS